MIDLVFKITLGSAITMAPFWVTYFLHGFAGAADTWDGLRWYFLMGTVVAVIVVTVVAVVDKGVNGSNSAVTESILLYPMGLVSIVIVVVVAYFLALTAGFLFPDLSGGLMVGSKFFGSSEEVRYFLHPVGVVIASFIDLVVVTWLILIFD